MTKTMLHRKAEKIKLYRRAVTWIALNEDISEGADGLISTLLVADTFDVNEEEMAKDVQKAADQFANTGN